MDSNPITNNKGGGIKFDTSNFTLKNLLVLGNGTAGSGTGTSFGGINVSAAGQSGQMSVFNVSLINNKADDGATASAALCPINPPELITNTVVIGNSGASGTEIQNACKTAMGGTAISYSSFVGAGVNTNHNLELTNCGGGGANASTIEGAIFFSPAQSDYHPLKGGTAPCTLVGQGTPTGAPSNDLDGTARPSPPSIGAFEPH
jgi:hypothetical protein